MPSQATLDKSIEDAIKKFKASYVSPSSGRRLAKVGITSEVLFELLTVGNKTLGSDTLEGLPIGAVFISSHFDERTMQAYLLFEHESFSPIIEDGDIPFVSVVLKRLEYPNV